MLSSSQGNGSSLGVDVSLGLLIWATENDGSVGRNHDRDTQRGNTKLTPCRSREHVYAAASPVGRLSLIVRVPAAPTAVVGEEPDGSRGRLVNRRRNRG